MNLFLVIALLCVCGLTSADTSAWNPDVFKNRYGQHYTQHDESISTAKQRISNRLKELGVTDDFGQSSQLSNYGSASGPELCTVPCNNNYGNNEYEENSKYSSQQYRQNANSVPVYIPPSPSTSSKSSSYSANSRNERISQSVPITIPVSTASERYSNRIEESEEKTHQTAQTVPAYISYPSSNQYSATSSSVDREEHSQQQRPQPIPVPSYSQQREEQERRSSRQEQQSSQSIPIRIQVRPAATTQQYYRESERFTEQREPPVHVYQPVTNSERYSSRDEQVHDVQERTIPFQYPVYQPSSSSSSSASEQHSSRSEKSTASVPVPIVAAPSTSSRYSNRESEQYSRTSGQQPIPIYTPTERYVNENSRYSAAHESVQDSYVPQPIVLPSRSSASRYSSNQESRSSSVNQPTYIPVAPVASTSSSSRYAANQNEQQYQSNQQQNGGRNGGYISTYPSGYDAYGRNQGEYGVADRQSSRLNSGNSGSSGSSSSGSAGGGSVGSGSYSSSPGLRGYISESERLAREQQQKVSNTGSYVGSSIVDSEFDKEDENRLANIAAQNGFIKAKAWERNSKWSSGSEYDENGKIKSYSTLSTGESEQNHANGKTVGYKAATSTLDDDGKVSTYSIHT